MNLLNINTTKPKIKDIIILSFIFFILLFLRRGSQLINPQVWDEDGAFIIPSFIINGWGNLLEPVSGYLITIPKIITNISMSISFIYYPEVSTYITWFLTILIGLLIVYAPTGLKYRVLAAIFVFLIPTNAEAFGLPLYMLWWSSIILFIVALWKQRVHQIFKNLLLIIAGFSTPVIVIMIPIQIFRAIFFERKKEEIISLVIAIVISIIQLSFIIHHQDTRNINNIDLVFLQNLIIKYFSYYYLNGFGLSSAMELIGGLYIVGIIIFYGVNNIKDYYFLILLYLLIATISLSVVRMGVMIVPIFGGGARYFFLPYIVMSWTLIYIMAKNKYYEFFILPILILSIVVALRGFCRDHVDLQWRKHIDLCQKAKGKYGIPIQLDGQSETTWYMVLYSKNCKELIDKDIFKLPKLDKNHE